MKRVSIQCRFNRRCRAIFDKWLGTFVRTCMWVITTFFIVHPKVDNHFFQRASHPKQSQKDASQSQQTASQQRTVPTTSYPNRKHSIASNCLNLVPLSSSHSCLPSSSLPHYPCQLPILACYLIFLSSSLMLFSSWLKVKTASDSFCLNSDCLWR